MSKDRISVFERVADFVSEGMGKPTNIIIWAICIAAWTLLFAFGGPHIASGHWLPEWFTSQGFNFPLNLITTVAELFIGFLVAANALRIQRISDDQSDEQDKQTKQIAAQTAQIAHVEDALLKEVQTNTSLTQKVHDLTESIHELVEAQKNADGAEEEHETVL